MSELNYHTTKCSTEKLLAIAIRKIQILVYLSVLDLGKTVMYELWHDYVKPKYGEKVRFWYMDTDNCIVYITTEDIFKGIAEDVDTKSDTSNYELNRPLPKEKKQKCDWCDKR